MTEVTLLMAKRLFKLGRKIRAVPDYVSLENASFNFLSIQKHSGCWSWPDERVSDYKKIYCEGHSKLLFFTMPVEVMVRRNGSSGFIIKKMDGGIFIYNGSDQGLVSYANQNVIHIINDGYLEPHFRRQLVY